MGVNDTTGFTPRKRFRLQLLNLGEFLEARYPAPLMLLSLPPTHLFLARAGALRYVMGLWASLLDNIYRQLASEAPQHFRYARYPVIEDTASFASDFYHLGIKGFWYIAEALAPQ